MRKYTVDEIKTMLERRYKAYEIPLYSNAAEDYANDEEVDEIKIVCLMTITHPDVLARIYNQGELEHKETDPDEIDDDWKLVYNSDDIVYSTLITQHSQGTRTSIVLESDGTYATSFKVYGTSFEISELLIAKIGFQDMKTGDLSDSTFQYYLECCAKNGVI